MAPNHSDNVDVGRLESENMLRNKPNSKFLSEVVERADMDLDEAAEMIEREKKILDKADQGFLPSLDLSMHSKSVEKAEMYKDRNLDTSEATAERERSVTALFNASATLLKLDKRTHAAINDAANNPISYTRFKQTRQTDQKRVEDILKAGRRVYTRELNDLDADDTSKHNQNENEEVNAQAEAIFIGYRKDSRQDDGVDQSLKYMKKGVRKMTKGLDADA